VGFGRDERGEEERERQGMNEGTGDVVGLYKERVVESINQQNEMK